MGLFDPITSEAERYRRLITGPDIGVTPEEIEEEKRKKRQGLLSLAVNRDATDGDQDDFEAPVHPGKDFGSYMAGQGGVSGFFGSVLKPKLAKMIFRDDLKDYRSAAASYETDKALFDIEQAGRVKRAENSAGDEQDEAASNYLDEVAGGEREFDPLEWAAIAGRAGGFSAVNPNGQKLSQGQTLLGLDMEPAFSVAPANDSPKTDQQLATWSRLNPDATREETADAYNNILRAGFTSNGVRFDSFDGSVVGGDVDGTYAEIQAGSTARGTQQEDHVFDSFEREQNRYIAAWDEHDKFDERIGRFDTAIELFDPDRPGGAVDTGMLAGNIFNMFGVGDEGFATIANLGVRETIDMLANFKGTTTDFEFTKSELGAFASILKDENVNRETLQVAREALVRQAKRNDMAAESAYKSMGDYAGDNRILGNSYDTVSNNYSPWFEQEGSQEGIIDGVPTFARFSADMEKRASDSGIEMSAEDIRALYNQHYPTPRK
jgi:hypothetical protein